MTRHLNACTKEVLQIAQLQIQHIFYDDKINTSDEKLEDRSQLLDETNYTVRNTTNLLTKNIPWNGLLVSEFLSLSREGWFTRNEFLASTPISNIKYNHREVKHQNSFYLFHNQLNNALAHYFVESEATKSNVNKFLSDLLMTPLTKKLLFKNADEWIKKLLEIP